MAGFRFLLLSFCASLCLIGCGGSLNRNNEKRDNMLYIASIDEPLIHGYDLEIDQDEPSEGGYSTWPMYRYFTEGVIKDMAISSDRRWVFAVNDLGKVESYESRPTGRLEKLPTLELQDGNALGLAIAPNSTHIYVASNAGKVFHYQLALDGTATLVGTSVTGPTTVSKVMVRPDGLALYILDQATSKIWQYSIGGDGSLSALTPSSIDVSGGPAEAVWNAASTRFYVSCQDSNQVALFAPSGAGQLTEQTRLAGPSKPGAPVLDIAELYLCVPSQDGDGEIWRYQAGPSFTALTPPRDTGHEVQANAILNPYGFFFVLNTGDDSYSAYRINEDAELTLLGTEPLELNPGKAVFRVNP